MTQADTVVGETEGSTVEALVIHRLLWMTEGATCSLIHLHLVIPV